LLIILTDNITPRLRYTLTVVFNDILGGMIYDIVESNAYQGPYPVICYNEVCSSSHHMHIVPSRLLTETGIDDTFDIDGVSQAVLQAIDNDQDSTVDVFSFIFYSITRYEEYLSSELDHLGRYKASNSAAYRNDFLHRALVDECAQWLVRRLKCLIPTWEYTPSDNFRLHSTIDIDQAWAYAHKGNRNIFGAFRDLFTFDFLNFRRRVRHWKSHTTDPFNTYDWITTLHHQNNIRATFFILLAENTSKYDKNHHYSNSHFIHLITQLAEKFAVGIHPSYQSNMGGDILKNEISSLQHIIRQDIQLSRQHFLMVHLPTTYQNLINAHITKDHSMGYAEAIGFRASTGNEYTWYDLGTEKPTALRIVPFQIMDVTLKNYLHLTPFEAKTNIANIIAHAKKANTPISFIWHNSSLDEEGEWKGWRDVYAFLLRS
jgi:hypothetical protein